jgi:hypothetical protein
MIHGIRRDMRTPVNWSGESKGYSILNLNPKPRLTHVLRRHIGIAHLA